MSDLSDFVGRGISFPMRVDQSGAIAMTAGGDDIAASLRMVLMTAPGERVMRSQFGCRIWDLLFEPINANTLGRMATYVREALGQWEPRAIIDDIVAEPDPADPSKVQIRIDYRIKATNDKRNLVYPFYVIPREVEP